MIAVGGGGECEGFDRGCLLDRGAAKADIRREKWLRRGREKEGGMRGPEIEIGDWRSPLVL